MQLFYAPDIAPPTYRLSREESLHAVRVLRMRQGDTIHLTDGRGTLYHATLITVDQKECVAEVYRTIEHYGELCYDLTVCIAPTKNIDRFEWFLEKATEVGISAIIPIDCAHSERRVIKQERSVKIVTEAMKQSLKSYHPMVELMTSFSEVVKNPFDGIKLIAHCEADMGERKRISDYVVRGDKIMILIGPEGDFSPEEITFALANGFRAVTLGHSRLRTETAGLASVFEVSFINSF